jgi:hypothetical protein
MPQSVKIGIQYSRAFQRRIVCRLDIFNALALIYKNILGSQSLFFADSLKQPCQHVINRYLTLFFALCFFQVD